MQRRYKRYFVILENEDTGFEISRSQTPKGYAKVEISNGKGIMMLHCQNLRGIHENRMRYRWYLVNSNKDNPTIVDIGPMEVDSSGKGEVTWEFSGENVKGTKESIEEFNLLLLLAESFEQRKALTAPLVGYIEKGTNSWRRIVERKLYGIVQPEKMKEEEKIAVAEPRAEEGLTAVERKIEAAEPAVEAVKPSDGGPEEGPRSQYSFEESDDLMASSVAVEAEPPMEEIQEELPVAKEVIEEVTSMEETEPEPIIQAQAPLNKPTAPVADKKQQRIIKIQEPPHGGHGAGRSIEELQSAQQAAESQENSYLLNEGNMTKAMQAYVESTLKMFPKVAPFEGLGEGYQWWHIYYNYQTLYRSHMPFVAYIDGLRPTSQYYPYQYPSEYHRQIYPYQHYLFGIQYDKQNNAIYYVYGIPGRRLSREQPYGGKTGFTYWHPCKSGSNVSEGFGYWLMHIDPKTGKAANPLKETKPLDVK